MFCQSSTLVKRFEGRVAFNPLKCKCWHCPNCVGMRLRDLADLCKRGRPTKFLTLTVQAKDDDQQADRACALVKAWRELRRRIKRVHGLKSLPFIAIFEETERGEPHLHILCRMPFVKQKWISKQMEQMIGAPVCNIQSVRSMAGVARYVSKYVSKAPIMWPGTKRYWRSLDWIIDQKDNLINFAEPILEVFRYWLHAELLVDRYLAMGWRCAHDGKQWHAWPSKGKPPPW